MSNTTVVIIAPAEVDFFDHIFTSLVDFWDSLLTPIWWIFKSLGLLLFAFLGLLATVLCWLIVIGIGCTVLQLIAFLLKMAWTNSTGRPLPWSRRNQEELNERDEEAAFSSFEAVQDHVQRCQEDDKSLNPVRK